MMNSEHIHLWQHDHDFNSGKKSSETKTLVVVIITLLTMFAEIFIGWLSNSMALLADGFHMGTHAIALGISLGAYMLARRHAKSSGFAFGTWKIEILGAYTSAIVLGIAGLAMIVMSVERFLNPLVIRYNEALIVAMLGLSVNIICALILGSGHNHGHEHDHDEVVHNHVHEHGRDMDLNLKSAYLHVVADALTSILAIAALLGAKYLKLTWLDPAMGILGAFLILRWAFLLLRDTSRILLDWHGDLSVTKSIREIIEQDSDSKVSDLHIWQVSEGRYACIVSVITGSGRTYSYYKRLLDSVPGLVHVTVEVLACSPDKLCTSEIR
ncbi:MAG TPA: CDF family Co(II)/Ni(II) efflux transporter DmeF [Desulfomonilia bacterium]